jgi:succinylglutamic semialdehyde dehydrogenase
MTKITEHTDKSSPNDVKFSLISTSPSSGEVCWQGDESSQDKIKCAVAHARASSLTWAKTPWAERRLILENVVAVMSGRKKVLAELISKEMGKPLWESLLEVGAAINKLGICVQAHEDRCTERSSENQGVTSRTVFRPLGVALVLGPFNLPIHLPNGHLMPLLLAGNAVIFKPSEKVPAVSEALVACFLDGGVPENVLQLLQGGRDVAQGLLKEDIQLVAFTGSRQGGVAIHRALAGRPEVLLALEMGGNNGLMAWDVSDTQAAAQGIVRSAWMTSGQRCVCARRLVISSGKDGEALLQEVIRQTKTITCGYWNDDSESFMGPLIDSDAGRAVIAAQKQWQEQGATLLLKSKVLQKNDALVSPGIWDVTGMNHREDDEVFGPLLQVIRVPNFSAGIMEMNATKYGLSAGYYGDVEEDWLMFRDEVKAGVINWNRPITGASSQSPFGGWGWSGNHRPSAYLAADWCSQAQASMELALPKCDPPCPS